MESTELARLRRAAGKQTTRLTHYGRKTGEPYEVTIWFVLDGEKFYIGTANVKRQWVRNVQKTPQIRLSIGGETFEGTARFLSDRAEHERAMAAIRRKYWMYVPIMALGRVRRWIFLPLKRERTVRLFPQKWHEPEQYSVLNEFSRLDYRQRSPTMTTPANAIKDEVWELIDLQIETFRQPSRLTSSELTECHYRAERIKHLGEELDRIGRASVLEKRCGRAA